MVAEFIGTFTLVFVGCGSIVVANKFPGTVEPSMIPVVFGLTVASMIYSLGHISGAHFNPAVTLAFSLARHFPKRDVLFYWIAQVLAGIFAISILYFLFPDSEVFGATVPHISSTKAVVLEAVLTFFLMFTIIAVATDTRAVGTMAGAAIGAVVIFCALFGGPLTGASMNPARSIGPAIYEGQLSVLWIYLAGPFIGATVAAFTYESIRCGHRQKDAKGNC